jgi:hypothetical protein
VFAWTGSYYHLGNRAAYQQLHHEIMAGIRLCIPNRSRLVPYFTATIGTVNSTYTSAFSSHADQAAAVGTGVDYSLGPRFGLTTRVRRVVSSDAFLGGNTFPSYGRADAGFYFRF